MTFCYTLYGLRVSSNLAVPGLIASRKTEHKTDLTISLQEMPAAVSNLPDEAGELWWVSPWIESDGRPSRVIRKLDGGAYYRIQYNDGFRFVIDGACTRLWVAWPAHLDECDLSVYLLGPVMGTIMRLRGVVCLHASAVQIGNRAVAFIGDAGAGKSTTAAGFAQLGRPVLTDDLVTLIPQEGSYLVNPGYPHLRLSPDTVEELFGDRDALAQIVGTWDKRHLDLAAQDVFADSPVPLAAVYVLGSRSPVGTPLRIESLPAREAMIILIGNTYGNTQLDPKARVEEFEFLGEFLEHVPVRKLVAPDDVKLLFSLCQAIIEDSQAIATSDTATNVRAAEPRHRAVQ